ASFAQSAPPTQEATLSPQKVSQAVRSLQQLINEHYFNGPLIPVLNDKLKRNLDQGFYDSAKTPSDLAESLTRTIYELTHDKHFGVILANAPNAEFEDVHLDRKKAARFGNFGIRDAEVL